MKRLIDVEDSQETDEACEPAQEPNAINSNLALDVLDDDCLLSIFSHLNVLHLIELEKVCRRFKALAQRMYKIQRVLDYEELSDQKSKETVQVRIVLREVRNISARLGPYVRTLKAQTCSFYNIDCILSDILKGFSNLENLHLNMFDITQVSFAMLSEMFAKLKVIELENCRFSGRMERIKACLQHATQLEILNLSGNDSISGYCLTDLRNIKEINLSSCFAIELFHFTQFCQNNPGLKRLNISYSCLTNGATLRVVANHLQSIESLIVRYNHEPRTPIDYNILRNLRCLKVLELDVAPDNFTFDTCLARLAVWNALQHVAIYSGPFTQNTLHSLCSLRELRVLKLPHNRNLSDENLIQMSFAKNFHGLQELHINHCDHITNRGIVEVIRRCRDLRRLKLYGENITNNLISQILPILQDRPATLEVVALWKMIPSKIRDQIRGNPKIKLYYLSEDGMFILL
ncbi:uncharacterized protein LOC132261001 isoform X1 [Phlebotomus argentipes]|uniref:uncharacterized protein LOC132261001 isoform X1 n=1 Tax=Phlebotomus argentipes TaxID=94469 RepID=UPI00289347B1|nr:uncharacterized protein LOC132261001 isoform X1 [Phlebotomus argentipes]